MSSPRRPDASTGLERRRRALAHALLVTSITTALTGCAHSLAGGSAPAPILLAAAFLATLVVLAPVLGARGSLPRRVVAIALAQIVQHGLYSLPVATGPAHHGHRHHGVEALPSTIDVAPHAHGDMLAAHVVAGLLTLAAVQVARVLVDAVAAAMQGRRLAHLAVALAPLGAPAPAPVRETHRVRATHAPARSRTLVRRGPPLLAV